MAEKDEDLDLDVENKKSGGGMNAKTLIIILSVFAVVVIGAAVGIALLVSGGSKDEGAKTEQTTGEHKAAEGEKKGEIAGKAVYVNIEPPFVVNFEDQTLVRYLQIGVSLMSHDAGAEEEIKGQMPLIKSKLLLLFSAQKYEEIKTSEGKQKLQDEALKVVREVLKGETGRPIVDQVLFTSFVMQ